MSQAFHQPQAALTEDHGTAGYQSWQQLTFLHWRVPADELQRLLPSSLTVETFDGSAWLGVVPFSMERVRPWWFAAVPGISWFLETNVRTYVTDQRGVRGVWFFSLDANSRLAVGIARRFWHLPYCHASMRLSVSDRSTASGSFRTIRYDGQRDERTGAGYDIEAEVDMTQATVTAAPGTLDHFLVERYVLFAVYRSGQLWTGRVHHEPYQYRPVVSCRVQQSLTRAAGADIEPGRAPDHQVYSEGVHVRVSPLRNENALC